MKAPKFDLKFSDEAQVLSEIILADTQPKHYIRRRAYQSARTNTIIPDSSARKRFEDGGKENIEFRRIFQRLRPQIYNVAMLHFFVLPAIFLLFAGVIIYYFVSGTIYSSNGIVVGILCGLVAFAMLCGCISYSVVWVRRKKYFERVYQYLDDLYVLFDTEGNPCCVCIDGEKVRILHKQTLYKCSNKKVKTVTDPKRVYLEYLDLFPQSLLDMSSYVPERKHYALAPEPGSCPWADICVVANETDRQVSLSANLSGKYSINFLWKIRKLLIDLDKSYNIQKIYSCNGKSFDDGITLATVRERGGDVYSVLKNS
ncbi:MAG: hypothetical protein K2N33_04705, partial [Clostridia bacterium]|nr:hypothetical protein [Clostridia bacterium]